MARDNVLQVIINADDRTKAAFQSATRGAAVFSAAITGALGVATQRAAAFEKGMAEIQTLLGQGAAPQVAAMRKELLALSKQSGETLGALTKARYDIISAGFSDASKSAQVLSASLDVAKGGLVDVSVAADLVTSAVNGLGLEASDSARVADVLFTTVKQGKTTMGELGQSLGQVFATAKVARVSLEEIGAAVATITANGINTREANTALNNLMLALAAPSKEAGRALADLGITLEEGLGPALEALGRAGDEGLDSLAQLIPNIRALKAAAAAGADIDTFNRNLREMENAAGAAGEAADIMRATLDHSIKQLRQNAEVLAITIGSKLVGVIGKLADAMSRLADRAASLTDGFVTAGVAIAATAAIAAAAAATFGQLAISINGAAAALSALGIAAKLAPALPALGVAGLAVGGALAVGGLAAGAMGSTRRTAFQGAPVGPTPAQQAQGQAILDARAGKGTGGLEAFRAGLVQPAPVRGRDLTLEDVFGAAPAPYVTPQKQSSDLIAKAMQSAEERAGSTEFKFQQLIGTAPGDLQLLAEELVKVGASAEQVRVVTDAMEREAGLADVSPLLNVDTMEELVSIYDELPSEFPMDMSGAAEPASDLSLALGEIRFAMEDIASIGVQDTMWAFSDAMAASLVMGESFDEVFTKAFKQIKAQLVSMIVQFIAFQVILKSVLSVIPGGGAIGKIFGFATGGTVPHAASGMSMVPGSPGLDRTLIAARGGEMILSPERAAMMRTAMSMPGQGRQSMLSKFRDMNSSARGFVISSKSSFTKIEAADLVDIMSDASIAAEGVR